MGANEETTAEVKTVFTVADQQAAEHMAERKRQADDLTAAVKKTEETLKGLGSHSKAPEHGGVGLGEPPVHGGGETPQGLTKEEQEDFAIAKAERTARRQRLLVEKVEQQKGQALHRAAEMALMAVVGEQNKYAAALAKGAATVESVGMGFTGFGGTLGKVGSVLAKFGEIGAVASLALEGTSAILEALDVDVEELEHNITQAGREFLGIAGRAHQSYKELGFASEADHKAAEEIEKRQAAESSLRGFLREYSDQLQTLARANLSGAQERYEDMLMELTKQARAEYKSLQGISLSEAMSKVEEQMRATSEYYRVHQSREAELEKMEENLAKAGQMTAIQYHATAEQMAAHYAQAQKMAEAELERGHITREETAAFAAGLVAQAEKHGAIQNEIDAMRENEDKQVKMADAVKQYTKLLKVVPLTASVDATNRMNHSMLDLANQAAQVLETMGMKLTGPDMDQLLNQFKSAMTEKQHRYFDFRGSHFDIKQAFEGLDPGRVSVAFVNDLASLSERRVQSGFAPLFGIRG